MRAIRDNSQENQWHVTAITGYGMLRRLVASTCEITLRPGVTTTEGFSFFPKEEQEAILVECEYNHVDSLPFVGKWEILHIRRDGDGKYFITTEPDAKQRVGKNVNWQLYTGDRVTRILEVRIANMRFTTNREARAEEGEEVMIALPEDMLLHIVGRLTAAELLERSLRAAADVSYKHRLDAALAEADAERRRNGRLKLEIARLTAANNKLNTTISRGFGPRPSRAQMRVQRQ